MYELALDLTNVFMVFAIYIIMLILTFVKNNDGLKLFSSFFMMIIGFVVLTSEWNFIIGLSMLIIGLFRMFGDEK